MRPGTRWYIAAVWIAAIILFAALYRFGPVPNASVGTDILLMSVLALAGETLSVLLPRSASGSMAFIPYFALVVVVPSWPAVLAVLVVRCLKELWSRRGAIKGVFNVGAHALMEAAAIVVYLSLGGLSLTTQPNLHHFTQLTRDVGGSAFVAFSAAFAINTSLVAGVVAVSSGRTFSAVWLENNRATVGADLLAIPLVFIFAWVYAAFGAIATAALWIPIFGLRQLQRTNLELEQMNEELLELMVKSLEARDPYTSGHSRRVQHYSTLIARAIGLSEREVDHVRRAALLHDVGKIYEKYAPVLAKADKLTPEEWALIQEHPADGANLVSTMTRLRDIVPAIRHHHENWDGTGYPDALAGQLVPLPARIIRFADTIDAMTSERPYRRPLTEVEVRAELVRCRGTQFDPEICDRLLSSSLWYSIFVPAALHQTTPAHFGVVRAMGNRRERSIMRQAGHG